MNSLNANTRVCLSVCSQGWVPISPLPMMHWTSLYRPPSPSLLLDIRHGSPLVLSPPDIRPSDPTPASDIWWPPLKICSKLFTSGSTHPNWHCTVLHCTIRLDRVVRILLKCFLVRFCPQPAFVAGAICKAVEFGNNLRMDKLCYHRSQLLRTCFFLTVK